MDQSIKEKLAIATSTSFPKEDLFELFGALQQLNPDQRLMVCELLMRRFRDGKKNITVAMSTLNFLHGLLLNCPVFRRIIGDYPKFHDALGAFACFHTSKSGVDHLAVSKKVLRLIRSFSEAYDDPEHIFEGPMWPRTYYQLSQKKKIKFPELDSQEKDLKTVLFADLTSSDIAVSPAIAAARNLKTAPPLSPALPPNPVIELPMDVRVVQNACEMLEEVFAAAESPRSLRNDVASDLLATCVNGQTAVVREISKDQKPATLNALLVFHEHLQKVVTAVKNAVDLGVLPARRSFKASPKPVSPKRKVKPSPPVGDLLTFFDTPAIVADSKVESPSPVPVLLPPPELSPKSRNYTHSAPVSKQKKSQVAEEEDAFVALAMRRSEPPMKTNLEGGGESALGSPPFSTIAQEPISPPVPGFGGSQLLRPVRPTPQTGSRMLPKSAQPSAAPNPFDAMFDELAESRAEAGRANTTASAVESVRPRSSTNPFDDLIFE